METERPQINQSAILVTSDEFDDLAKSGTILPNQRYTITAESAQAPDAADEVPTNSETPQSQEPLQRVGINYAPGEPPLEAYITGSKPDPNRPGMTLYEVMPVNPEDAADFPKVAPQEAIVSSSTEVEPQGETLTNTVNKATNDEIDPNARKVSLEERQRNRALLDARHAVEAAYSNTAMEGGEKPVESTAEHKSAVDKASEILDDLEAGVSDKDRIALQQYANGSYANKPYEMTAAEKKMSGAIINNRELKIAYAKAWASLMDARKTQENQ